MSAGNNPAFSQVPNETAFDLMRQETALVMDTCDTEKSSSHNSAQAPLRFTIYGDPVPLTRHRLAHGRMYNPAASLQKMFAEASDVYMPETPLEGPLVAHLAFYFQRPKSHYGTGRNAHVLKKGVPSMHAQKKDLDNLIKFVLDALNTRAYLDDGQVVELHSQKLYTNFEPRIEVRFAPAEPTKFFFSMTATDTVVDDKQPTTVITKSTTRTKKAAIRSKATKAKDASPSVMLTDGTFVIEHCKT